MLSDVIAIANTAALINDTITNSRGNFTMPRKYEYGPTAQIYLYDFRTFISDRDAKRFTFFGDVSVSLCSPFHQSWKYLRMGFFKILKTQASKWDSCANANT